jgi:hypothetical protein
VQQPLSRQFSYTETPRLRWARNKRPLGTDLLHKTLAISFNIAWKETFHQLSWEIMIISTFCKPWAQNRWMSVAWKLQIIVKLVDVTFWPLICLYYGRNVENLEIYAERVGFIRCT